MIPSPDALIKCRFNSKFQNELLHALLDNRDKMLASYASKPALQPLDSFGFQVESKCTPIPSCSGAGPSRITRLDVIEHCRGGLWTAPIVHLCPTVVFNGESARKQRLDCALTCRTNNVAGNAKVFVTNTVLKTVLVGARD